MGGYRDVSDPGRRNRAVRGAGTEQRGGEIEDHQRTQRRGELLTTAEPRHVTLGALAASPGGRIAALESGGLRDLVGLEDLAQVIAAGLGLGELDVGDILGVRLRRGHSLRLDGRGRPRMTSAESDLSRERPVGVSGWRGRLGVGDGVDRPGGSGPLRERERTDGVGGSRRDGGDVRVGGGRRF